MIEETTGGGGTTSKLRFRVSGIAFAFFGAACGDHVVTTDGQLSEGDAGALFAGMLTLQTATANAMEVGAGRAFFEIPCPRGGVSQVDGYSWMGDGVSYRHFGMEAVMIPAKCRLAIDDQTYATDGDPYLRADIRALVRDHLVRIDGEVRRNIMWRRENVSGSCMIDMVLEASLDLSDPLAPIVEGGYGGSVCGHGMDVEWDPEWTFYCSGDPGCTESAQQ